MPASTALQALLDQLEEPFTAEQLFDHLSDVVDFIKNLSGEYQVVCQLCFCGLANQPQPSGSGK